MTTEVNVEINAITIKNDGRANTIEFVGYFNEILVRTVLWFHSSELYESLAEIFNDELMETFNAIVRYTHDTMIWTARHTEVDLQ